LRPFTGKYLDYFDRGYEKMDTLIHWFLANGSVLAILVTAGVAVLLVCCLGCSNCGCREKDEIFKRRQV